MRFQDFDLSQAAESYLLANTPLFLVRRLQADSVVQDLARNSPSSEILTALKISLLANPESLEQAVWPHVLVTALFLNGGLDDLQEAAGFTSDKFKWYNRVAAALLAKSSPLNRTTVNVPPEIVGRGVGQSTFPTSVVTVLARESLELPST